MTFIKQEYEVVKKVIGISQSTKTAGTPMTTIILKGLKDGKDYRTYVVKGHKNTAQWQAILDSTSQEMILVFKQGRVKAGTNIIDADSQPIIAYQKATKAIAPQIRTTAAKPAPNQDRLNDIFG